MLPQVQEYLQNLRQPRPSFSLQEMEGFPYNEYNSNLTRYSELETWFDGTALNETVERQGKPVELYPLKFNPIPRTIEQHTYYLFGQVQQDDRPLVYPKVKPLDYKNEQQVKDAEDIETILHRIWAESGGRALQWTNGSQSQLYGGNIFRIAYDPFDPLRTIPLRIESIHPKSFVCVPDGRDLWRIREAWIIRAINHQEALEHGVEVADNQQPWLVEHVTDRTKRVTINGEEAYKISPAAGQVPLSGENRWGFVPIVYIPHTRVFGFYGETFVENVQGIVKEMNLRLADYGDAVTTDAHQYLGMRHVRGAPVVQQIAPGIHAINLMSSPSMSLASENDPDLFSLGAPRASQPMQDLVNVLWEVYRRVVAVPAIADGEDEGSQRSAATLVTRMISLISHTDSERIFWSTGLNLLARMLIKMLLMLPPEVLNVSVKPEYLTYPIRHEWASVLPRDREVLVQEVVALMAAKLGSIERLLDLLGVDNPSEERDKIIRDWKEITKAQAQPEPRGMQGSSVSAEQGTPARVANQE